MSAALAAVARAPKSLAPHLTPAQEDRIVREFLPLVDRCVAKALGKVGFCCDADELRSAASMGLVEAVRRYDDARGIPFAAFAKHRIQGAILDELRSKDFLPRPSRQRARAVETARQKLVRKLRREPTEQELAKASGEDLETFQKKGAKERAQNFVALEDLPAGTWQETIAGEEPTALDRLVEGEREQQVAKALKTLPERLQTILSLYYQEELSYREIGDILGVTESRICQLIKGAQKQLKGMVAEA